jgi:DNA replication and repair protein RecF
MRILRLQLFDYRNIERLDLELPRGASVFVGGNAEGKSNLLESVYLLATMRASRVETDSQLIRSAALDGALPAARVIGHVETAAGPLKVEVAVTSRPATNGPSATKTVRIDGVPRRVSDSVGRLTAVLFTAEDLEMLAGSPSLRRRYLDMTLMQVDRDYATARHRFERVLTQRNHLLKRIREGAARREELEFWDSELVRDGSLIMQRRAKALSEIAAAAGDSHAALAPDESLSVQYEPRMEGRADGIAAGETEEVQDLYGSALVRGLGRDIAAGMTLQGPHRDDVHFELNGVPAAGYASRAQQRTIALSLRLAEARFLAERRGEPPVLLLDDILSEMDAGRRQSVLSALRDAEQMLVTGTDWDRFGPEFLEGAGLFEVSGGVVEPAGAQAGP